MTTLQTNHQATCFIEQGAQAFLQTQDAQALLSQLTSLPPAFQEEIRYSLMTAWVAGFTARTEMLSVQLKAQFLQ